MSKLKLAAAITAAALGLVACRGAEENNVAVENLEEMNAVEDMNMDMGNMDVDMNDVNGMNAVDDAVDNATANETTDNSTNSY